MCVCEFVFKERDYLLIPSSLNGKKNKNIQQRTIMSMGDISTRSKQNVVDFKASKLEQSGKDHHHGLS